MSIIGEGPSHDLQWYQRHAAEPPSLVRQNNQDVLTESPWGNTLYDYVDILLHFRNATMFNYRRSSWRSCLCRRQWLRLSASASRRLYLPVGESGRRAMGSALFLRTGRKRDRITSGRSSRRMRRTRTRWCVCSNSSRTRPAARSRQADRVRG